MKIFIVDDEAPARSRLQTLLGDIAAACPHQQVGEAGSAAEALQQIPSSAAQVVLLDVQMPGMNGLELASHLQKCNPPPLIIFVTAFDEYAVQAFDVHALDYLLKPVRAQRLQQALQRAAMLLATPAYAAQQQQKLQQTAQQLHTVRRHFSVQERGRVLLVPVEDVLYLRAEQKYVSLRTKSREYLIEESLVSIEEEMQERFVRVHRNALVARDAIAGVQKGTLADAGEEGNNQECWLVLVRDLAVKLPISRRQWPAIKALVK